jgi:deoxyribodipyrimidine photo-lyase
VPELQAVPTVFIHEPWKMNAEAEKAAGCEIGRHYPRPVVDHKEAVRQAREKFGEVTRRPEHRAETQSVLRTHGSRKRATEKPSDSRRTKKPRRAAPDADEGQLELGV